MMIMTDLSNRTILMVIAPSGFRDEELFVPEEFFEKNGAEVVIASDRKGTARGMLGRTASVDLSVSEVDISDYDAVVFVGGSGVESHKLYENEAYLKLAADADSSGKVIGAIFSVRWFLQALASCQERMRPSLKAAHHTSPGRVPTTLARE